MSQPDHDLVHAARAGDVTAFAILARRHWGMAHAVARRVLRDPYAAEDAVQDALLIAWKKLHRLATPTAFGPWLAGIARNVCRDRLRGRSRVEQPAIHDGVGPLLAAAASVDPATVVEHRDGAQAVHAAVAALPRGQRDAVTAFYLEGLSQAEVAQALGTTLGAVKTRLHKARAALRARLGDERLESMMDDLTATAMQIIEIGRREASDPEMVQHVVALEEIDGDRRMEIWIGESEAIGLAFALEGIPTPRPLTHQLTAALLSAATVEVRAATITRLVDVTFHATITVARDGATVDVDARPSDALTLASLTGADIHVSTPLLWDACAPTTTPAVADAAQIVGEFQARQRRYMEAATRRT